MAQFYRGNSDNVIGSPARVLLASSTYPVPTKLADIISLTTLDPNPTYGFIDLGVTRSPAKTDIAAAVQTWRNEQFGVFRTVPTDWKGGFSAEFLETTQSNKQAIMLASTPADSAVNEHRTNFAALINFPIVRLAVLYQDQFSLAHASVFPRAQWDGAAISETVGRGQEMFIPMAWVCYPDSNVVDAVTGQACVRYDFDQYTP